jgi:import inner membrane translocase subunit TIM9
MYNSLVHRCFDACANSFKSKTLDAKEKACIEHCSDKFIKLTQRVGFRYSEVSATWM